MSRWKPCVVPNCQRPASCRCLCDAHYKRLRRGYLADAATRPLSHQRLVDLRKIIWGHL